MLFDFHDLPWKWDESFLRKWHEQGSDSSESRWPLWISGSTIQEIKPIKDKVIEDLYRTFGHGLVQKIYQGAELTPLALENLWTEYNLFEKQLNLIYLSKVPKWFDKTLAFLSSNRTPSNIIIFIQMGEHPPTILTKAKQDKKLRIALWHFKRTPFWELKTLFKWFLSLEQISLPAKYFAYLISALEETPESYESAAQKIKLLSSQGEISYQELTEQFPMRNLGQFALAKMLNNLQMRDFYHHLVLTFREDAPYLSLFYFLQNHLQRLLESTNLQEEHGHQNNYHQEIRKLKLNATPAQREGWYDALVNLSNLEAIYKIRRKHLLTELRYCYLQAQRMQMPAFVGRDIKIKTAWQPEMQVSR